MNFGSPWRSLLQATFRVNQPQVSSATALRNAFGVAVPLALGLAVGQELTGLAVAVGALIVSFSDVPGPYPLRVRRMLLASLAAGLSAFVGSATASLGWLPVVLVMLWGLGGGLLVALGPDAAQVGLASIILLVIYSGQPLPLDQALITGCLIFAGGAFQTLLAVAEWPFRPLGPECDALATVFRALAAYTGAPSQASLAPPLTVETTTAQVMLSEAGRGTGDVLRSLLDDAERIRLVIIALDDARHRLRRERPNAAVAVHINRARSIAGEILTEIAKSLESGHASIAAPEQFERLDAAVRSARSVVVVADPTAEEALILLETLVAQLRAATETSRQLFLVGRQTSGGGAALLPSPFDLRNPIATLRANLTVRAASFRHAVRLAVSLGVADALARGLGLPHGYWVPLTVALVLKPDFSATFVRGILRVGGTLLGLVIATVLVRLIFGNAAVEVALIGVLVFAIRRLAAQNYGLAVIWITALVVVFFSLLGVNPETTIVDRGLDTLIGGGLALVLFAVWPTWEHTQRPTILANLLDAYRDYFDAVMVDYLDPQHVNVNRLRSLRLAARLARTNAEASIERLRGEPLRSEEELDRAVAFLAASNRFVRAAMALEAQMSTQRTLPIGATVSSFVYDVDAMLQALAYRLRNPSRPMAKLPNLRADVRTLTTGLAPEPMPSNVAIERRLRLSAFAAEIERIVDSLEAMVQVILAPRSTYRSSAA